MPGSDAGDRCVLSVMGQVTTSTGFTARWTLCVRRQTLPILRLPRGSAPFCASG